VQDNETALLAYHVTIISHHKLDLITTMPTSI